MYYPFDISAWQWKEENEPILKGKSYGKGHFRHNWQQKTRANNLKLAKRRKQNKARKQAKKNTRR